MKLNTNYSKLEENYLFTEIAVRTKRFVEANPDKPLIKLGIGDVAFCGRCHHRCFRGA